MSLSPETNCVISYLYHLFNVRDESINHSGGAEQQIVAHHLWTGPLQQQLQIELEEMVRRPSIRNGLETLDY